MQTISLLIIFADINNMFTIMEKFRITEICKEKGMTQTALAEKIGISRVGLSKAINGNTTIQTLEKIAEALGVEVAELFTPTKPTYVCPHCGKALHIEIK